MRTHECDHPLCDCRWDVEDLIERQDGLFCSVHCAREGGESDERCECGHPECTSRRSAAGQGPPPPDRASPGHAKHA